MAQKTRTIVLGGITLALVAALGFVAFRNNPVPVDLHRVTRGAMLVTLNADGKTRIREVFEVASPISGTVLRAPVRVGDLVVAGETIVAVVEPASSNLLDARSRIQAEAGVREAEAALHLARSRMREAGEDLTLAEKEYQRAKVLVERGVASVIRLDTAEQQRGIKQAAETAAISGLEMSKSALDSARAVLSEPLGDAEAPETLCCLRLTAPADGRVLEIDVISKRPVTVGTRLLTIGQPDDLEIVADVLSSDAVKLKIGDRAIVERWGRAEPLEARIRKISPAAFTKVSALGIAEQRVDVVFDLVTAAERRPELGDGFSVFLRIVAWEGEDVLTVPLSAIFRSDDHWAVFTDNAGAAQHRRIEIGPQNAASVQVLDGLSEADRVIMHPSDTVADGVAIVQRARP